MAVKGVGGYHLVCDATDADVVVLIGTRLADFATGSYSAWQNPDVKFISINVSSAHAKSFKCDHEFARQF